MVKRELNKGFTLIEMLIVLICISSFSLLSLNHKSLSSIQDIATINLVKKEIMDTKLKALKNHLKSCTDTKLIITQHDICFNANGNVNQAQTISILKSTKQFVIHLGSGHYEVK